MNSEYWFLFIGALLLGRGLTSTLLSRSPFSSSIIYLVAGVIAGPMVLNLFHFDPIKQSRLLEIFTEIAVLISLFSAGVKMPVPVTSRRWGRPILLAWVSMTLTVAMIAGFAYYALHLPLGAAVLLGAILAPTDPVLATDVQSRHPGDNDHLRFTLTSEAGMNDGSAFPFVMLGLGLLGLHDLGEMGWHWLAVDVLWATASAIAIGVLGGSLLAHIGWKLRASDLKHEILDDLVGLGLIALLYGFAVAIGGWGFLTVFFSGVALRQTEQRLASERRHNIKLQQAGYPVEPHIDLTSPQEPPPNISAESLIFGEHLERLSEMMLVLLLGGMLALQFWNWQTIALAAFVFLIARPLSVIVGLSFSDASWTLKGMIGWFGVRGIGSIYYLMYAIQHQLPEAIAAQITQCTLVVVSLSIIVHGTSVKPLMVRFWGKK